MTMKNGNKYPLCSLVLLAAVTLARGQVDPGGDDLSELINTVFTSPPPDVGTDTDCECVPYYLCENNTIITDGAGVIDIRIKDDACSTFLEVCCTDPQAKPSNPPIPIQPGCGNHNPEGVGFRITGGVNGEAQFAEFPWMTAVLKIDEVTKNQETYSVYTYQCGGSLIHPNVVLTAAHCVIGKKPEKLKIRAGEWDTQTTNELFTHQDRDVSEIIIHENYYAGGLYNDVALLLLSHPIEASENIGFVCLPGQGEIPAPGTKCFASGWGKDVYGKEGKFQVILKKVELPFVERNRCLQALRTTRLGIRFKLHSSFVCAGGVQGKDTCKGDGGSPLVCPIPGHPGKYYQSGIVAWGIGCGENGIPGVYVNIAGFRNWIDNQLRHNNLDSKYYHIS